MYFLVSLYSVVLGEAYFIIIIILVHSILRAYAFHLSFWFHYPFYFNGFNFWGFIIWPSNFSTKLMDVNFVYRVVWSVLPYDLHNYPISIIQYSCDFISGPVSYRVSFYLSSSETELEGWSSHSRFLYIYMLGFFQFFYHFWGTNQWFCDFFTVIIVIISLLMGRGDIVRNILVKFPFPYPSL